MRSPLLFLFLALAIALAACSDDDDGDDGDPSPTAAAATSTAAAATATAETPTSDIDSAIRSLDLESDASVQALIAATGGVFSEEDVSYIDLTADNVEEATVVVMSGGTAGGLAVVVLTPDGDSTRSIFEYQAELGGGLAVNVVGGQLVTTEPVPGPDDPECCPSELRTTIYAWDGEEFVVESETVSPNPQAGSKTPVSP